MKNKTRKLEDHRKRKILKRQKKTHTNTQPHALTHPLTYESSTALCQQDMKVFLFLPASFTILKSSMK